MGTQVQPKVVSGNAAGYDPLRVKRIAWRLFVFFFTLGFGFSMHLVTQLLTYLDYEYRVEPAKDVVFNLKNCDFQILKDADRDGLHARWLYADDGGVKSSGLNDANDYKVENDWCHPGLCHMRCMVTLVVGHDIEQLPTIRVLYPWTSDVMPVNVFSEEMLTMSNDRTLELQGGHINVNVSNIENVFDLVVRTREGHVFLNDVGYHTAHVSSTRNNVVISAKRSTHVTFRQPRDIWCLKSFARSLKGMPEHRCPTDLVKNVFTTIDGAGNADGFVSTPEARHHLKKDSTLSDEEISGILATIFQFEWTQLSYADFVNQTQAAALYGLFPGCRRYGQLFIQADKTGCGMEPSMCNKDAYDEMDLNTNPDGGDLINGCIERFEKAGSLRSPVTDENIKVCAKGSLAWLDVESEEGGIWVTVSGGQSMELPTNIEHRRGYDRGSRVVRQKEDASVHKQAHLCIPNKPFLKSYYLSEECRRADNQEALDRCLCLEQALTTEDRNGCMQTVLVLPQSNQVDDNLCVYDVSPMMQLRRSDMLRLQRDTAAKYALMDSIEDAVVVFDIKMPHLPDGLKWLYVSRWLYLYLEPHTLGSLSFGLLKPRLINEPAVMAPAVCAVEGFYSDQDKQLMIHAALSTGVDPRDSSQDRNMRGSLAFRSSNSSNFVLKGDAVKEIYRVTWGDWPGLMTVLVISLFISAVLGVLISNRIMGFLRQAADQYLKMRQTVQVLIEMKKLDIEKERASIIRDPSAGPWLQKLPLGLAYQPKKGEVAVVVGAEADVPAFNFTREEQEHAQAPQVPPFELMTDLLIRPARAMMYDSLDLFIRDKMLLGSEESYLMILADFKPLYEHYCLEKQMPERNLLSNESLLRDRFNVRLATATINVLVGVRWLNEAEKHAQTNVDAPKSTIPDDAVRRFVFENCVLTFDYTTDMIPLESFVMRLDTWCHKEGNSQVELMVEEVEQFGVRCQQRTAVVMHGLKPKPIPKSAQLDKWWFVVQTTSVWIHMLVVLLLPYTLIQVCISNQDDYANSLSSLSDELQFWHVFTWKLSGFGPERVAPSAAGRPVLVQNMVFFILALIFWLYSALKLLVHYLEVSEGAFRRVLRMVWYSLLFLVLAMDLAYFSAAFIWLILGALIKPQEFLPYCSANLACWLSAMMVQQQLRNTYRITYARVMVLLDSHVDTKIKSSRNVLHACLTKAVGADPLSIKGRDKRGGDHPCMDVGEACVFQAFRMFDADGDHMITFDEFVALLEKLDIALSLRRAKFVFASCDVTGNGLLEYSELTDCLQKMKEQVAETVMHELQESTADQVVFFLVTVASLICIVVSYFVASSTFLLSGAMPAVVNAALIVGLVAFFTKLRLDSETRPNEEKVKKAVKDTLKVFAGQT